MESWGMDEDEIRGTLEDFGDGGAAGVSGASLDGDGEDFEAATAPIPGTASPAISPPP